MRNTSEIRKTNHFHILQILASGEEFTVAEMSQKTGLCVATCNTIMREMVVRGEVLAEKRQLNDVGRSSLIYRINQKYKSTLYVYHSGNEMVFYIAYYYGGQRGYHLEKGVTFSEECILPLLKKYVAMYSNIVEIVLSVPVGTDTNKLAKVITDEMEILVNISYSDVFKMQGYALNCPLDGKTVVLIQEKDEKSYEFTVFSDLVRMGNPINPNHVFLEEEAKHVLYVLVKLLSPEEILFVGNNNVFEFFRVKEVKNFDGFELKGMTNRN